jgi:hypothetical protein
MASQLRVDEIQSQTGSLGIGSAAGSVTFNGSSTFSGGISISGGVEGPFTLTSSPFLQNVQSIAANYTVAANYNAMSIGPIGINTGVTVAIQTGGNWAIV